MTERALTPGRRPVIAMPRRAASGAPSHPRARESYSWLDAVFGFHMYLIILILGYTYNLFNARVEFLIPALGIDLLCLGFCLFRNIRALIYGLVALFLPVFYICVFSVIVHVPVVLAQAGAYVALYAIGVFGIYARNRSLTRAMWMMFLVSLLYQVTFLVLRRSLDVDAIAYERKFDQNAMRAVMRTHDALAGGDLSYRIYVADFSFAFAMTYALARFRSSKHWIWLLSALFSLACFVLSDFRFATAVAIVVFVISLVPLSTSVRLKISVAGVLSVMALFLVFALTSFNIYEFISWDTTGNARFQEVAIANDLFWAHPWLGIGLAGSADDMYRIVGDYPFAASDIGYLGMLCRFGLVGYLGLLWINLVIPRFVGIVQRNNAIPPYVSEALANLLIYVMLMQGLVTYMLDSGGALLIALMAGYWATMHGPRRPQPGINHGSDTRIQRRAMTERANQH